MLLRKSEISRDSGKQRVVRPSPAWAGWSACGRFVAGGCVFLLAASSSWGVSPAEEQFRRASRDAIPEGWEGPVFQPSMDFPASAPEGGEQPWLEWDFRTQPLEYAHAVLKYALEGNVETEWGGAGNPVRTWYHVPWLHYHRSGREFIRGLTRERDSLSGELHEQQTERVQNWGIGLFNPVGGHVVGRVWADPEKPEPSAAVFPPGAMMIKLIFTRATVEEVPYLKGAPEWVANVDALTEEGVRRQPGPVRLVQFDFAVRDERADPTGGWVFGAFIYDGTRADLAVYDRLVPLGISWGNDPGVTAEMITAGEATLAETRLNEDSLIVAHHHRGYGGRLNGMVDNPGSSCISCHATAQSVPISAMTPPDSLPEADRMRWFENRPRGEPFDAGQISLDFSLQLAQSIRNFQAWESEQLANAALETAPRWLRPLQTTERNLQPQN